MTQASYQKVGRITVSKSFRDRMLTEFPGLVGNVAYMRLMDWLLFGLKSDTGMPVVPASILADIENRVADYDAKNYSGKRFLDRFKRDVMPTLEYSDYDYAMGIARELTVFPISDSFRAAYELERQTKPSDLQDRVYLVSGAKFTPKSLKAVRDEDRESAMKRLVLVGNPYARSLMTYLNTLNPKRFSVAVQRHFDAAWSAAERIPNEDGRKQTLTKLRAIADQPTPFYGPANATVRLFTLQPSIAQLPRDIRKVLTQDWATVDLRAAQLAIVAKVWNLPIVEERLRTGVSIWPELVDGIGYAYNEDTKQGVKKMLYGLVFGSGISKNSAMRREAAVHFPDDATVVDRFLSIPLIAVLYERRQEVQAEIRENNGMYDAFGQWIEAPREEIVGKDGRIHILPKPNTRSVLATVAQSYELRLLWPVFNAAINGTDFDVVLYLFDGCSVACNDNARRDRILYRLKQEVEAVANELGIYTTLEFEAIQPELL